MTLPDFIYSTYTSLLEGGWRMTEIDQADLLGYLRIQAWNAKKKHPTEEQSKAFIDTVWPSVRP